MGPFISRVIALGATAFASTVAPAFASVPAAVVPEPATWALLGSGLAGLAAWRWYRSK